MAAHLLTLPTTNIDARNVCEATALLIAAWCGNLGIVKLLLENGASIDAMDMDGNNVLVSAALGFKDMMDEDEDWMDDSKTLEYRELIKYLVQEVGLPVPDQVLELLAEDPETLAVCQRARGSCRSYLSLGLASSSSESEEDSSSLSVANLDTELPKLLNIAPEEHIQLVDKMQKSLKISQKSNSNMLKEIARRRWCSASPRPPRTPRTPGSELPTSLEGKL